MPNRHFLVKFWKCRKAMTILPHEAKALLEVFCLQQIVIGELQNSSSSSLASWGKIKIHDFTLADQDWIGLMIFENFADQDWIGFNFIGSGLDSNWKILQFAHLCRAHLCLLYGGGLVPRTPAVYDTSGVKARLSHILQLMWTTSYLWNLCKNSFCDCVGVKHQQNKIENPDPETWIKP